jgi:hypothetical protein
MTDNEAAKLESQKRLIDQQLIAHAQAGGNLTSHRIKRHRASKQLLVGRLNYQKVVDELAARAEALGLAPDAIFEKPRLKSVNDLIRLEIIGDEDKGTIWDTFAQPPCELEPAEYAERESQRTHFEEKP